MKTENKKLESKRIILLSVLGVALFQGAVQAESHGIAFAGGYLLDTRNDIVRSGFGECWRTERWRSGHRAPECGGAPAAPRVIPPPAATLPTPPAAVEPESESEPEVIVRAISLGRVNFAFDRSDLNSQARSNLDHLAVELQMDDSVDGLDIVGHTDSVGTDQYNQALSERRARSVADYLEQKGIPRSRMTISGKGESEPVASNATREGRAMNRRTEIWVRRRTPVGR